ncbi:MAG: SDR family oxidoreductase [Leptospirales bacterium]|jgi:short-subunit dehydrogenase
MNDAFTGKRIVITGASGGLGRVLCSEFGGRGATIVGLDVDGAALDGLKTQLNAAGIKNSTFRCDITDETACAGIAQEIITEYGGVDILINNAGITHFSRLSETAPATIRRVMEVNFMGTVNVTTALLPELIKSRGNIVAMSSVAGFAPLYARTLYSASKHAIHGFFNSLRTELLEQNVRVMVVCPSFIATQGEAPPPKSAKDQNQSGIARPGQATETAGKPLQPEFVAKEISSGIIKGKSLLIVGPLAKKSYYVYKIFPGLYERIMIKKMRGELA